MYERTLKTKKKHWEGKKDRDRKRGKERGRAKSINNIFGCITHSILSANYLSWLLNWKIEFSNMGNVVIFFSNSNQFNFKNE